jgi:hypothetical protein
MQFNFFSEKIAMKWKVCFVVACLFFIVIKTENPLINAFRSFIQKKPIFISLASESNQSGSSIERLDVHVLSRFLKEAAMNPCLLLTEESPDKALQESLFPKAEAFVVSPSMHIDLLKKHVLAFAKMHGGRVTVFTNLSARANDVQAMHQAIPQVSFIAVDSLLNQDEANTQVDMPKLLKLMKRNIRVVCTAALIPMRYEKRKNQYIRSLQALVSYGYNPYVVESCAAGPTFLDEYSNNVCYTLSNDARLKNKGVNESVSLLKALEEWNFNDEDIILKLTGRYFLQSDKLLRVLEELDDVAAVAKFGKFNYPYVLTGCFAMRCDLMKQMYASFDYQKLEKEMICIEDEVGRYLDALQKKGKKLIRLEHLGVEANVFRLHALDKLSYW